MLRLPANAISRRNAFDGDIIETGAGSYRLAHAKAQQDGGRPRTTPTHAINVILPAPLPSPRIGPGMSAQHARPGVKRAAATMLKSRAWAYDVFRP
ncbi:hypothetical protein [Streptomyces sp. NPDC001292]|uniref:hypothetical protein n=1 Tax=Streptomyces sp. NPDC001292 TaxID=3364558 RepID=UPI0036C2378A